MRVYVTGCMGQLGRALYAALEGKTLDGCDLPELDINDRHAIAQGVRQFAPDVVIHTAALTDVDGCARDPDLAYRVNTVGTQNVALACAASGAAMVYISTNEVFDGESSEPYREWHAPNPINPYAHSKAGGEWFVRHLLTRFYIVRTAWLYAPGGHNFPHRVLQLADEAASGGGSGEPLRLVTDEVGNPTYAPDLARGIASLIRTDACGVYHLTNAGHCSRYDFAREILRLAGRRDVPVEPITLDEFERDSDPPRFAPLANTTAAALGIELRPWRAALAEFVGTLKPTE